MRMLTVWVFLQIACSPQCFAAFTHIQGSVGTSVNSGKAASVTLTSTPSAGNLVACMLVYGNAGKTATTITAQDGNGNSYAVPSSGTSVMSSVGAGQVFLFYLSPVPSGASKTITATAAASANFMQVWCDEYHASTGVISLDTAGVSNGTSNPTTAPTLSPATTSELYAAGCSDTTFMSSSPPASFSWGGGGGLASGCGVVYKLTVSTSTTLSWGTAADGYVCFMAAFQAPKRGFQILQ